jgi:DNA-binding CsgD family transcriptional regulator
MQRRDSEPKGFPQLSNYFPPQLLLSALNDSKIGVVVCDRRMRYKALNETVAEIHNVPIEAHLGHGFHEVIGGLAATVVPLWDKVFSTGQPLLNLQVTGHLPKRSEAGWWIENLFPLTDDRGRVAQVGCFVIEIAPGPLLRPSPPILLGEARSAKFHRFASTDRNGHSPLSPREREVVRLVAEGKSNKEISVVLGISVRTVETHRARVMLKINATSIAQLVHYAIRNHIVTV